MMELGNGWYWLLRRIYAHTIHHRFWLASNERLNLPSTPRSTLVFSGDNFPCYPFVQSLNWLPGWVMWPMGLLFYDVTVDIQIWALLTRSQCRSSLFLTLILVFLHRIEQLKALLFDSSSDTSSSSPDSSCHHKRL